MISGAEPAPLIQGGLEVCADCGFPGSGRSHEGGAADSKKRSFSDPVLLF